MVNREKVMIGLEIHTDRSGMLECHDCPYNQAIDEGTCMELLCKDAFELLKEQGDGPKHYDDGSTEP